MVTGKSPGWETQDPRFLSQHYLCDLEQITGLPGIMQDKGKSMIWSHPKFEAQLCCLSQTGHVITLASVTSSENWGYREHPVGCCGDETQ